MGLRKVKKGKIKTKKQNKLMITERMVAVKIGKQFKHLLASATVLSAVLEPKPVHDE